MARKSLTGQLNMFDLFKNIDDSPMGEVEMVSLVPWEEPEVVDEPEVVEEPEVVDEPEIVEKPRKRNKRAEEASQTLTHMLQPQERPVMSRQYEVDGRHIEIAYINYNKVRITKEGEIPEIRVFDSSKEAVDYYVEKMQELEPEE